MLFQRLKFLFFFAVLSWVYSTVAFGQAKEDGEVLEKDIPLSVSDRAWRDLQRG